MNSEAEMERITREQEERFDVCLDITLSLRVQGRYNAGRAACLRGHPDNWRPEEGAELEITQVSYDNDKPIDVGNLKEFADEHFFTITNAIEKERKTDYRF